MNADFIQNITNLGLSDAQQLCDGSSVYVEFSGTAATVDLMRPNALQKALVLSSDLAIYPAAHIIIDDPEPRERAVVTGTRLPFSDLDFRWGHHPGTLTEDTIRRALGLYPSIAEIHVGDSFHRVADALLFYENGYNSQNPDLALIGFTTCLDGLFSTVEQEVSFRLSLRLSHFLADENERRREVFDQSREVYKVRSKIVHGASIDRNPERAAIYLVENVVPKAERLARRSLQKILTLRLGDLFSRPAAIERLFDAVLFSNSLQDALRTLNPRS